MDQDLFHRKMVKDPKVCPSKWIYFQSGDNKPRVSKMILISLCGYSWNCSWIESMENALTIPSHQLGSQSSEDGTYSSMRLNRPAYAKTNGDSIDTRNATDCNGVIIIIDNLADIVCGLDAIKRLVTFVVPKPDSIIRLCRVGVDYAVVYLAK